MAITEISTSTVQIAHPDVVIDAYLAQPKTAGTYPGIIVVQEIFGVNPHIQDVTRRIAEQGYIAIAPAIYQRQAPGFSVGYGPEDVTLGRKYKVATKATELLSDLQATINYLYNLPNIKTGGVGTVGFCFGGHVVYLAATLPEVKATASFYGAQIVNWCPGEDTFTVDRTKDIQGTIYCFFGMQDPLIPNEQNHQIEAELQRQNIEHQVFRYEEASHGFFCDRRDSYDQIAAEDSWRKVLDLFSRI